MKKYSFSAIITLIILLSPVLITAQSQDTTGQTGTEKSDVLVVQKAVRYNSEGRQDPFIDLEVQKKEKSKIEAAQLEPIPSYSERQALHPGVRGMLITELVLQGIVKRGGEYIAFFQGVDNRAHFLRTGDELYNAKVVKITKDSVVFEEYKRYINKTVETTVTTVHLHE